METESIVLDRGQARALYRKYREHQHYSTPIDWEIQRTYQAIAQGRMVIRALDSIKMAGLGEDGLPKLAIVRADAAECFLEYRHDGSAIFATRQDAVWRHYSRQFIALPPGSLPPLPAGNRGRLTGRAIAPLIPIDLRPKRGLENYHLLWEAEWRPLPPVDPMLLRRVGEADLWIVLAAWDLTEVERAALAARIIHVS